MNRWLTILLTWLSISANAQQARYAASLTLSASNFVDTVTIEWEHNRIYVPVEIGGKHYRFLFDTGAAQSVVYADMPVGGCKPAGFIRSYDAVGGISSVPMVVLPPIRLGRLTLTGCQATIQQRPVKGHQMDGILGFNLINSGLSVKIDVRHRQLILTDTKDFFNREQGLETRYRLKYHVPYIEVNPFGQYKEPTLFDTGSRSIYAMSRQSFDACQQQAGSLMASQIEGRSMGRHAIGHSGVEERSEVVFLRLSQLRMCDFTLRNLHALTVQGESHLGAGILNYGAVVFNPRKKRFRFQPYDQRLEAEAGNKQLDIAFVSEQGMPCVGLVWEQGKPYAQGFREGDIIVKIDGRPVQDFTQFVGWAFERGREYRFTVKNRQGITREVKWVRIENLKN